MEAGGGARGEEAEAEAGGAPGPRGFRNGQAWGLGPGCTAAPTPPARAVDSMVGALSLLPSDHTFLLRVCHRGHRTATHSALCPCPRASLALGTLGRLDPASAARRPPAARETRRPSLGGCRGDAGDRVPGGSPRWPGEAPLPARRRL